MKIKLNNVFLFLILLLSQEFLTLIILDQKMNYNVLSQFIIIFLIILIFINTGIYKTKYKKTNKFLIQFLFLVFISIIYVSVTGMQPFTDTLIKYLPYSMIVLGLILIHDNDKFSENDIKNAFKRVSLFLSILYIVQQICYPNYIFLRLYGYNSEGIRIICGSLTCVVGLLFYIDDFFSKRYSKRITCLLPIIFISYSILTIIQSRSLIFAFAIAVMFYLYKKLINHFKERKNKRLINLISFIFIIIASFFIFNLVGDIVNNSLEINESSSISRLAAYQYYFDKFLSYPIFGVGLILNQKLYGLTTYGVLNKLYIDDIGICGFLAQFGLLGFILFLIWIRMIGVKLKENKSIIYSSIFCFYIMLLPFNCLFNISIGILPVCLLPIMIDKSNN